jgi:hypothetical protein
MGDKSKGIMKAEDKHDWSRYLKPILIRCAYVLVVLFLIAIIIPVFSSPPGHQPNKFHKARFEMEDLVNAIQAYEDQYGRLPIPDGPTNGDITLGISPMDIDGFWKAKAARFRPSNADIMVVLMSLDAGANKNFKLNSQRTIYLNAQIVPGTNSPGVSRDDFEYRDPWGHPYIISLDTDGDGLVRDGFYAQPILYPRGVGTQSLVQTNGLFQFKGPVMIWSLGPDGKASFTNAVDAGVNRDNLTSW